MKGKSLFVFGWRILFSMSHWGIQVFIYKYGKPNIIENNITIYWKSYGHTFIFAFRWWSGGRIKTVNLWVIRIVVILPRFFGWFWRKNIQILMSYHGRPSIFIQFLPCKHWKDWSQEVFSPSVVWPRSRAEKFFFCLLYRFLLLTVCRVNRRRGCLDCVQSGKFDNFNPNSFFPSSERANVEFK